MQTLPFKQGGTFSVTGTVLLPAGTWSAACQIRDSGGGLIATLDAVLTALQTPTETASHAIVLSTTADTSAWTGTYLSDVKFTDASVPPVKVPSETFAIAIERSETQ